MTKNNQYLALDLLTMALVTHHGSIVAYQTPEEALEHNKSYIPVHLTRNQLKQLPLPRIDY